VRLLVVGSAGAGKSTLAVEVARRLDLPLIHLDRHFWQPGCPEKVDLAFLQYIWRYPRRSRPRLFAAVESYAPGLPVVRLRSRAEVRRWLDDLPGAVRQPDQ
jgi:hypothetical protein